MKSLILKSIVVAFITTCVSTFFVDLCFTGVSLVEVDDKKMEEINRMPYEEAVEVFVKDQQPMRGFAQLWTSYTNPLTWQYKVYPMGTMFILTFLGCLWVGKWHSKRRDKDSDEQ